MPDLARRESISVSVTCDDEFGSIIRILWIFEGDEILGTKVFAGIPSFMEA